MQIPKQVKVGGIRYKVKIVESDEVDEKVGAVISAEKCTIKLVKGEKQFMEEAFLHELFFTINMEYEEPIVEFFAQSLYQIIVDNPTLFQGGERHD